MAGWYEFEMSDPGLLFELRIDEARCHGYGDVLLRQRTYWRA
jgi:hypothetical protein